jgi:hypothetical protein
MGLLYDSRRFAAAVRCKIDGIVIENTVLSFPVRDLAI